MKRKGGSPLGLLQTFFQIILIICRAVNPGFELAFDTEFWDDRAPDSRAFEFFSKLTLFETAALSCQSNA